MQLTFNSLPIWLASEPIYFRKAIDGWCGLIVEEVSCQPSQGIFIFYNHSRNRLKIIACHINGFMMIYKRFEKISSPEKRLMIGWYGLTLNSSPGF